MPNAFPDTPVSLLSCIEERRGGVPYQHAWKAFFDLYHAPIRLAVLAAFRRCNWRQVPDELLEETVADVVISFFKATFSYDPSKGKFRSYLHQLCNRRVFDCIEKFEQARRNNADLLEMGEPEISALTAPEGSGTLEEAEREAYRSTLLATMLEDVRHRVSPQTFLMFELTKIQGQSPDAVAAQFRVKRNVVDNASYRVLSKLKELAIQPEYRREYFE